MPAKIKTAAEVISVIDTLAAQRAKEKREFAQKRAELEFFEDLRDDVVAIARNSGLSFGEIHARGGPTVGTLTKWMDKEVHRPWLGKMRSTLRICGHDFAIVETSPRSVA